MTLKEAFESGRRYKHPQQSQWFRPNAYYSMQVKDAIRDDWQIEPEPEQKIEITKEQLTQAFEKVMSRDYSWKTISQYCEEFAEELGFK